MSMARVATKNHNNAWVVGHQLRPCWGLRDKPLLGPCPSEQTVLPPGSRVKARPKLLPLAISGPMVLLQLGSVLMYVHCLCYHGSPYEPCVEVLKHEGHAELTLPLTDLGRATLLTGELARTLPLTPSLPPPWRAFPPPIYLEKLAPPLTTGMGELTVPLTWGEWSQEPRPINSTTPQAHTHVFELAFLNIYPSMTCWITWRPWPCGTIATGSPWLRVTVGYLRGVLVRVQKWWYARRQGPWSRATPYYTMKFANKAIWTKG